MYQLVVYQDGSSRREELPEVTSPEVTWPKAALTWNNVTGSHMTGSDRERMHNRFPPFMLTMVVVQNVPLRMTKKLTFPTTPNTLTITLIYIYIYITERHYYWTCDIVFTVTSSVNDALRKAYE